MIKETCQGHVASVFSAHEDDTFPIYVAASARWQAAAGKCCCAPTPIGFFLRIIVLRREREKIYLQPAEQKAHETH